MLFVASLHAQLANILEAPAWRHMVRASLAPLFFFVKPPGTFVARSGRWWGEGERGHVATREVTTRLKSKTRPDLWTEARIECPLSELSLGLLLRLLGKVKAEGDGWHSFINLGLLPPLLCCERERGMFLTWGCGLDPIHPNRPEVTSVGSHSARGQIPRLADRTRHSCRP